VRIDLGRGTASGGHATGDRLSFILKLVGSDFDDTLIGDGLANWLEGGAGADILDGGANPADAPDYASYFRATSGVVASLADPSRNTGDAAGDTYRGIEALEGSNFGDILTGDAGDNFLSGYAGDDVLVAGVGAGQQPGRGRRCALQRRPTRFDGYRGV
jgi:Ca2+-binding RTX toxin-like protein